jgi:hypothetical protein
MYTHLCAALLALSAWAAWRFFESGRTLPAAGLALAWAALAMTRSMFPMAFLLLLAGALVALNRFGLKRPPSFWLNVLLLVPAALNGLWCMKNQSKFGEFSASSWMGMSMAKVIYIAYPREDIQERGGKLLQRTPFSSPYDYLDLVPPIDQDGVGIPALDDLLKPSSGANNYNCRPILLASQRYKRESVAFILGDPWPLRRSMALGWWYYFFAPGDYWTLEPNRSAIRPYQDLYAKLVYLSFRHDPMNPFDPGTAALKASLTREEKIHALMNVSWTMAASFLAVAAWFPLFARRALRSGDPRRKAQGALALYVAFVVLYMAIAGNALEVGENHRFRFMVEPLCWIALAHLASEARKRFRGKESNP